jgi:hypothetical protein
MPNWCSNYLVVTGSADAIRQINEGFQKRNAFENLIGKDPSFAEEDWYNHNCSRYGTKWDVGPITTFYEDGDTELVLNFDTAWSSCAPFVKSLCNKYKTDAVLEYSESGNNFAGRVTLEWEGKEGRELLCIHEEEWEYHEGLYILDRQAWFDGELEWAMENAHERELTDEQFVEEYASFMTEEDKQHIIKEYQEYREDPQP